MMTTSCVTWRQAVVCHLQAGELLLLSQRLFDQNTLDALLHGVLLGLQTGNSQSQLILHSQL